MDPRTNREDLRREALRSLAESRAEIAIKVARLREKMDVKSAASRVVQRHPDGVIASGFVAGLALAFLVFHHRSAAREAGDAAAHGFRSAATHREKKSADHSLAASLARAAMPVVVKLAFSKPWHEWVEQFKQARAAMSGTQKTSSAVPRADQPMP